MLPPSTKLISVDDHVIEPPDLWTSRLPSKCHDAGPRVVELASGGHAWQYEGQRFQLESGVVRLHDEGLRGRRPDGSARFDEMRPGCYQPAERLRDMDLDGVWASLCFPNFTRFAGHRFLNSKDPELGLACLQAYNDFVTGEWRADPARLLAVGMLPLWDVERSVAEVRRLTERGASAIAFTENPVILGLPSIHTTHWEPLWGEIEESGLPVCMHIGSSSRLLTSSNDAPGSVLVSLFGVNAMITFSDWIFSGILDRFARLRVVLSEGGAGWIPYSLERLDKVWGMQGPSSGTRRPPREVYREHFFTCMVTDRFAIESLEWIGADRLMWESDYPHNDGVFPESRVTLERTLAGVADADAVKIAYQNAADLFGLGDGVSGEERSEPVSALAGS